MTEGNVAYLERSLRLTLENIQRRLVGGRLMLGLSSLPDSARAVLEAEIAAYEALEALAEAALRAEGRRERLEGATALIRGIVAMRGTALSGSVH